MPLLLYLAAAALLLFGAHRRVRPLSRGAAALLLLLPFVLCGWALLTGRVLAPVDLAYDTAPLSALKEEYGVKRVSTGIHTDVYTEFVPWRQTVRWSLARGEWGLWNRYAMSGEPLLGTQQTAVFSPITLAACLLPVGPGFTFTAAIVFFIAALTAFLLARELGCSEAASMIAAAGWMFATPVVLFTLTTMGQTWAWCPLLLLAVRRVVERPSPASAALLTFAFTMILYAGHPESAVLCVFMALLFGLFELVRARSARPALYAAGAGIAALLLSAVHLLPFLEALGASAETRFREAGFVDAHPATPWWWSLARMAITLVPYLHDRRWNVAEWKPQMLELEIGAVGSVILALAVYAVLRVRSATSWFLGALALFSLLAYSEWTPVVAVMRAIPVLEMTLTDRLSFSFALCACILAAMAADRLRPRAAAIILGAVLVLIAAGNWWAATTPLVVHGPLPAGGAKVPAEIAGLALATAALFVKPRFAAPLLLGLVLAQRAVSEGGLHRSFTQRQFYPPVPLFEPLRAPREPFRIVGQGDILIPQTSTMYGLEDARGVPSLTLHGYLETFTLWCTPQPVWFQRVDDLTRPFLSFLNVRYALSDRPPPPGWRAVAHDRGTYLHENTRVLPRAFLPRSVSVGYPRAWNYADFLKETDFAARAWIEAPLPPHLHENPAGTIAIRDARFGYVIDADVPGDAWIVTSIPAWPGWRARLDARPTPLRTANHAFLGLHVPKGKHTIRLTYLPSSFLWGSGISAATLLLSGFVLLARSRRRGSRTSGVDGDRTTTAVRAQQKETVVLGHQTFDEDVVPDAAGDDVPDRRGESLRVGAEAYSVSSGRMRSARRR